MLVIDFLSPYELLLASFADFPPTQWTRFFNSLIWLSLFFSVESNVENPFRPGGELSREAEEIVNLIKEGKPITPTSPPPSDLSDGHLHNGKSPSLSKENGYNYSNSSTNSPSNTSSKQLNGTPKSSPGVFEVKRAMVTNMEPSEADVVMIKRKSKCRCCILQ